MTMSQGSAQSAYERLITDRQPFLDRARECSRLTIPSLIPPESSNSSTDFTSPYQSFGSRAINNLANKLLVTLFPPNAPFFRLTISDSDLKEIQGTNDPDRGQAEDALASIERTIVSSAESRALRTPLFEALKHLLVGGNGLAYLPKESKSMRFFKLDQFVINRDPMGNVLEILVKESVSPLSLPQEVVALVETQNPEQEESKTTDKNLDLYTHVKWTGSKWESYQEIKAVPFNKKTYPKDKTPWLPIRHNQIDGEAYGRGLVEEHYGDLKSLETLTGAIVQGSHAAAKILFFVKPNGSTQARVVEEAMNGDVVKGDADDVSILQLEKFADFRIAQETATRIEERLAQAFLLHSSVQRQAERVTAEEIRFMAQELEGGLGGTYSLLSQELQLPLVTLLMHDLEVKGKLPKLPKEVIKPTIVTGLEALGRGQDLNRLLSFMKALEPLGPEVIARELNLSDYIDRLGASFNIDTSGLIKSDEQKQQEAEAAQQQQMQATGMDMAGKVAPVVAKEMANQQGR